MKMMRYRHQGQFIPKRKFLFRQDQFFHLPTTIAANDPFLRRLYGVVALALDDHPYPSTPQQFAQRTIEIEENIRRLNLAPDQLKFLRRLMKETGVTLVDLWQGSHIITRDNGYLYDIWSRLPEAHRRSSSHYGYVRLPQYGIDFQDHQLLFGKTAVDGSTWFQMEAHGFDAIDIFNDPDLFIYHGQDFLKYRIHNMNVGPFGFSPHTEESDPIIVPYKPIRLRTEPKPQPQPRLKPQPKYFRNDRYF